MSEILNALMYHIEFNFRNKPFCKHDTSLLYPMLYLCNREITNAITIKSYNENNNIMTTLIENDEVLFLIEN